MLVFRVDVLGFEAYDVSLRVWDLRLTVHEAQGEGLGTFYLASRPESMEIALFRNSPRRPHVPN